MENEKSEHVMTRAVAGATRMPSDATDDDEVRERGAFPEVCFHCGRPNPVPPTQPYKLPHSTAWCHSQSATEPFVNTVTDRSR